MTKETLAFSTPFPYNGAWKNEGKEVRRMMQGFSQFRKRASVFVSGGSVFKMPQCFQSYLNQEL